MFKIHENRHFTRHFTFASLSLIWIGLKGQAYLEDFLEFCYTSQLLAHAEYTQWWIETDRD
jgi:hypothetical protein